MNSQIEQLTQALAVNPDSVSLLLERAKLFYKIGDRDQAINDLLHVRHLDPQNSEASAYLELIQGIFEFRHIEIYNA